MPITVYRITPHAKRRMAQRNITVSELEFALERGHVEFRAGAKFYFLGKRDLPIHLWHSHARLAGLTIVVANDEVLTLYRNPQALADIRRKTKRRYHPDFVGAKKSFESASYRKYLWR